LILLDTLQTNKDWTKPMLFEAMAGGRFVEVEITPRSEQQQPMFRTHSSPEG
jgi:hypothetical protein